MIAVSKSRKATGWVAAKAQASACAWFLIIYMFSPEGGLVYHAWVLMLAPQPPMGEFYHSVE